MNTQTPAPPILCLSHLGWDRNLFQRPQQIMSRLAATHDHLVHYTGCVGLRKARELGSFGKATNLHWRHISYAPGVTRFAGLRQGLAKFDLLFHVPGRDPIIWLYHPSLLPLVQNVPRSLLVYDVMDRFDAFDRSSSTAATDEHTLLQQADVIFTGGQSLQTSIEEKLKTITPRTGAAPACFPSGIDYDHFSAAAQPGPHLAEVAKLPHPIFGYFGAIDERIDYDLIKQLAASGGSIAMIGPQIAAAPPLPSNVHLLGARAYIQLPAYLRDFDVCLLPFKQSALVAHISPTKTPEYLAGGKPVVSTMIPDVTSTYGHVVAVTQTTDEFVAACHATATEPPPVELLQSAARRARTWDQIAAEMRAILLQKLA